MLNACIVVEYIDQRLKSGSSDLDLALNANVGGQLPIAQSAVRFIKSTTGQEDGRLSTYPSAGSRFSGYLA